MFHFGEQFLAKCPVALQVLHTDLNLNNNFLFLQSNINSECITSIAVILANPYYANDVYDYKRQWKYSWKT